MNDRAENLSEVPQKADKAFAFWYEEISENEKAIERDHWESADRIVERYRLERGKSRNRESETYNILYSNTETIRPLLFSGRPKCEVNRLLLRDKPEVLQGALLLERSINYCFAKNQLAAKVKKAVLDYLLAGIGTLWFRYEQDEPDTVTGIAYQNVCCDYLFYKDFIYHVARDEDEVRWKARKHYFSKSAFTRKFGKKFNYVKAQQADRIRLSKEYSQTPVKSQIKEIIVYEIWDKTSEKVIWFCKDALELLLVEEPPLSLDNFFPCPKSLRAIVTTDTMIPRPFYSQYQYQADRLDSLGYRSKLLLDAIRVGVAFDESRPALRTLLESTGNKAVPVPDWTVLAEQGGLKGVMDTLSIDPYVAALASLNAATSSLKNDIYEITGWSDILRGASKASETLGAQEIKTGYVSVRLEDSRDTIREFVRDCADIIGQICAQTYTPEMFSLVSGLPQNANDPQSVQVFYAAVELLKNSNLRCFEFGIETDSTILPDNDKRKKENNEFFVAISQSLQQIVPAIKENALLAPILGELLMFVIRTYSPGRQFEERFQSLVTQLTNSPEQINPQQEGAGNAQLKQAELQFKQQEAEREFQVRQAELQFRQQEAERTFQLKQAELQLKQQEAEREFQARQAELQFKQQEMTIQAERDRVEAENARAETVLQTVNLAQSAGGVGGIDVGA